MYYTTFFNGKCAVVKHFSTLPYAVNGVSMNCIYKHIIFILS